VTMKSLLVLYSFHHNNTEQVANAIAKVLDAQIKRPQQTDPDELQRYDLVGFGSGIYSDKHHKSLFALVEKLPPVNNKKVFIFSTSGAPAFALDGGLEDYAEEAHLPLREKLQSKGYTIIDEFMCPGHNTNSFLKAFGGLNKGRPNTKDLKHAEAFAQRLKQNALEQIDSPTTDL
jgi:flavodoxin